MTMTRPPPSIADKAKRAKLSVTAGAICFFILVCLSLFGLSGWQIWTAHEQQMRESTMSSGDLTRSLAQHADSSIKGADTVLIGLVWNLEREAWSTAYLGRLRGYLRQETAGLPQLFGIFVIDRHGENLIDSLEQKHVRPNVAEREYFNYHRTHADRSSHIGAIVRSKISGKWILPISRRLNHADGSFAGVVVASIDLDYFQNFYDSYNLGGKGVILLLHRDSTVLVRRPALPAVVGTRIAQSQLFQTYLPQSPAGVYTHATVLDHIEKLTSYRLLEHYPLVVVVGLPVSEILADWRSGSILLVSAVTALALLLAALGLLLLRALKRSFQAEGALLDSERRIRIISDNLPLAIGYVDSDEKLQFINHAFAAKMQRSAEEAIGLSFATLLGENYAERIPFVKAALAGKAVLFERSTPLADGSVLHLESRYIPDIDRRGRVRGFYAVALDISARKHLELEQQNAHRELQTIIDNMSSLVSYWDRDLCNRFGNAAYLSWYGVTPAQMRGKHLREIIGADAFAANLSFIEAALAGQSQQFECDITLADGRVRHEVASIVPDVRQRKVVGIYVYVTDITPLKQARSAQFEARAQLQGVIDAAREFSIIATDLSGVIRIFSAGAERMLGYRADELVGKRTPSLLLQADDLARRGVLQKHAGPHDLIDFNALTAIIEGSKSHSGEWTMVHKNGARLSVHMVTTAIENAEGEMTGLLGVAREISGEKQLLASLKDAKEQAERASRAKSEFVANMSHEIRTPMNAVLGMAQLLGNTPLSSSQRKYVDMVKTAGRSLLDILNDILDFSKIEAGRMELSVAPFRLSDVLGTLATLMVANGAKKDLEIVIGVEPNVPDWLLGDAPRLQQVLLNIAGNAVKFTERGEVALIAELAPGGRCEQAAVDLCFRVRDTGIGISAAQRQRLFSAFSQAEESTARRFGGTGLGLVISQRLVAMMDGAISVESELGRGSQFLIGLTLAQAPPEARQAAGEVLVQHGRRRVLLVDDNQTNVHYLALIMRSWQWQVDVAVSAGPALELMREALAANCPYDAVLADWPQPSAQEAALFDTLRALAGERRTSFITMVNPYFREELARNAFAAEPGAVLIKPITASTLFDTFNEAAYADSAALPISPEPPAQTAAAHADAPPPAADGRLDGISLLLVEDNLLNQMVAKGMLENVGACVHVVDNGKQALDHLTQHPNDYHMVLMDVQMPVMDGFMATRAIRGELHLQLPILAMSAGVMLDERDACSAAGMNDFIAKPLDQAHMIATIRRHLASLDAPPDVAAEAAAGMAILDNFDYLYDYLPDDPVYRRGISDFIARLAKDGPQSLQQARIACDEGRYTDAAQMVHAMRGSLGAADREHFAPISLALEQAILSPQRAQMEQLFSQAEMQVAALAVHARTWLVARGIAV